MRGHLLVQFSLIALIASPLARAESVVAGAAALASVATSAAVSGIQASSNVAVAHINADLAKYQVDAVAKNSEKLMSMQQQTTMYQTYMASLVNAANQLAVSTRLGMQLALAEKLSILTMNMKQMQFDAEFALKKSLLDLQERQLGATIAANESKLQLMAVQAGLSTGVAPGDSGGSLITERTGMVTGESSASIASEKLLSSISNASESSVGFSSRAAASSLAQTSPAASPLESTPEQPLAARAVASEPSTRSESRGIRSVNAYKTREGAPTAPASEAIAVPFQLTQED